MEKRVLLTLLILFLLGGRAMAVPPFTDISGHWAEEAIEEAWREGYLQGYPGGIFDPDGALTRAQWVQILTRVEKAAEIDTAAKDSVLAPPLYTVYQDVKKNDEYYKEVDWFYQAHGVTLNAVFSGKELQPYKAITRREAAALAVLLLPVDQGEKTANFSDVIPDDPYYQAIVALSNRGIVAGFPDGTFQPDGTLTRGQAAAIIERLAAAINIGEIRIEDFPGELTLPREEQFFGVLTEGQFGFADPEKICLAAYWGLKRTGGYSVHIEKVESAAEREYRVIVTFQSPVPGISVTQALTYPRHVVTLSRDRLAHGDLTFLFMDGLTGDILGQSTIQN